MTNEEAIKNLAIVKNLEDALGNFDGGVKNSDLSKSLAMAIKALGHQPCDDCISRQAAIEAIARMMPHSYTPDGSHPADEEIFRAQEVFADCIEALEILPSAQPAQRWIPVSERLPKAGEYVKGVAKYYLVQNKYEDMLVARYTHSRHWEQIYQLKPIEDEIVAWMPLPEPYKAESEDE